MTIDGVKTDRIVGRHSPKEQVIVCTQHGWHAAYSGQMYNERMCKHAILYSTSLLPVTHQPSHPPFHRTHVYEFQHIVR